ncbi:MAG: phytoene/squalene synthase family protein [Gammaproteobacteria bacterium]|nr:phytoene/squalene synthase family protein [Gammaproteobacteria bacterium]
MAISDSVTSPPTADASEIAQVRVTGRDLVAAPADLAACRASIRVGSKTFHAASLLLPRRIRGSALALYAFCREADDAIDRSSEPQRALEELQRRLDRAYRGDPLDNPADRALAAVVAQFEIPQTLPAALLEGFAWDATARDYHDLSSVRAYGVRVAGTVGVMMSLLMGVRSTDALARAADLGVAMQLSNIARDVGEDARMGRLYLPRDWLREAGFDPDAWLREPHFEPRLGAVIDRLLAEARMLYQRAAAGVDELPVECRPAIHAARLMYAAIGDEVSRRGGDSVSSRAVVSGRRKLFLLAEALIAATRRTGSAAHPVLPEAQYLLDAISRHDRARGVSGDPLAGETLFTRELSRVLGVFERLERA